MVLAGMEYARGVEADEKTHAVFHRYDDTANDSADVVLGQVVVRWSGFPWMAGRGCCLECRCRTATIIIPMMTMTMAYDDNDDTAN